MKGVTLRRWREGVDDLSEITALLHRAYRQLAEMGFRYHATWQDEQTTLERLSRGIAFVAQLDSAIVGTATLYLPPSRSGCAWFSRDDVARFGQFGVEPSLQRQGIGARLLDTLEATAIAEGMANLALDTAEGATHLIEWYERCGYGFVCYADWEITNYRSLIMNKPLARGASAVGRV